MGPKRKAQEEDVEPQEGKKSKVSTSPADEETTSKKDQLLARFIKAGKEREEAEGIPDRSELQVESMNTLIILTRICGSKRATP